MPFSGDTQSSEAVGDYIYQLLERDVQHPQIRLFELQEGSPYTSPLLGRLLPCILQQQDSLFEALSYTWGEDSQPTHDLIIDGKKKTIRQNLFDALQMLRYHDRPRLLWIDAICINQEDAVEKSQQVPLMGQIYATACTVQVWLGEAKTPEMDEKIFNLFNWLRLDRTFQLPWRKGRLVWSHPSLLEMLQVYNDA